MKSPTLRKLSVIIAWLWVGLVALSVQAKTANATVRNGTDGTRSASRLSLAHVFSTDAQVSIVSSLESEQAAILDMDSQLVVTTTAGRTNTTTANARNEALVDLAKSYSFTAGSRVAFRSQQWKVGLELALNGSVWTRLEALPNASTYMNVCVVVLSAAMDSPLLIQATERVDTFCAPQDFVVLGFTSSLSRELAQYLNAEAAVSGKYVPRIMREVVDLSQQKLNTQLDVQASANRLFVSFPTAMCLENGGGLTESATRLTTLTMELCAGDGCTTCAPTDSAGTDAYDSPSKRGLVVLLSCGSFLLGCGLIFYVFFRKQFLLPSENTKAEKDLTTNLAYVLRM